ncbi:kynurenine/alpha-aminoadipate aminotransferase, mitochondrial-like [Agrilus planipennis]|uniref:Kynurenine/alpha-aminoadipate aminotransferase, mitochondrial-like n=1 Tax=Agrilus planipennis TaxID=224129 RepID=A0A1W4WAJ6_AGRPL|nr:kynurenine/alpha-aminoadipate aminotransferase, mitochondrial-like [Agrilus planipennis]
METTMDYRNFIKPFSGRRRPNITRELTKLNYNAPKEAISLAEGMPNEATFPFEKITVQLKDGSNFTLRGPQLGSALQYLPTRGYPPLVKTLSEFTYYVHQPPNWEARELIVTNGSQDGLSKCIEMMLEEGDPILVQNPLYAGIEGILKPFKASLIPVPQDQNGIIPIMLKNALEDWKKRCTADKELKMPKLIYLNPTGSNPCGATIPLERRKEIYKICCDYNIIILEDNAYYFIHFNGPSPPSFLSLDTEGRVLHFDSFSKVLSSGLRLGWVTGPSVLIQNLELHIQSAHLHSSTLSQVMVQNLLKTWGFEKLIAHFGTVCSFYKIRRDCTVAAMERHLKGLCDWVVPSGGMFVWIKVRGVGDVYDMLLNRGVKNKHVTFVPGHAFMADPNQACNYIRAAFSKASPKQIDKAMSLLAELIREEKVLLQRKLSNCT